MLGSGADHDAELENLLKFTESPNAPLPEAVQRQLRARIPSLHADIDLRVDSTTASYQLEHSQDSASLHRHDSGNSALLARLEACLSPIRNLPREIIGDILAFCVWPTVHITTYSEPRHPPWNLTQICSVWRDVALGLPSLWNVISVEFSCARPTECAHFTTLLQTFLSRTRNTAISLTISVAMFYDYIPFCQPFINSIIDVVQPYVGRLKHLELQPSQIFMSILGLPSGVVDALEHVNLEFSKEDGDSPHSFTPGDGLTNNITAFDNAANLQSVTLTSQFADMHLTAFLFPWAQLTHLVILDTYVAFADGHAVLRQCTNLVDCIIGVATDSNCDDAGIPPTHLPNLVSLNVQAYAEEEEHGLFLQPFILPSLRELGVVSIDGAAWAGTNVTNLLKRSKISKLDRFDSDGVRPQDLLAILTEFPAVVQTFSLSLSTSHWHHRLTDSESSMNEVLTAIARGDLAPNTKKLNVTLEDARLSDPHRRHSVTIRCSPEEMQPAFRDFWFGLRSRELKSRSVAVAVYDASGNLLGINGSLVNE